MPYIFKPTQIDFTCELNIDINDIKLDLKSISNLA